jgi:hypothetical protein
MPECMTGCMYSGIKCYTCSSGLLVSYRFKFGVILYFLQVFVLTCSVLIADSLEADKMFSMF